MKTNFTRDGRKINFWISLEDWLEIDELRWNMRCSLSETIRFILQEYREYRKLKGE